MDELCDLAAVELCRLIGARQISPVELLASCRARVEHLNGALNAFVATCWERAEAEARAAERAVMTGKILGPLHGLPIGIKDLALTEGLRTTFGSPQSTGPWSASPGSGSGRGSPGAPAVIRRAPTPRRRRGGAPRRATRSPRRAAPRP